MAEAPSTRTPLRETSPAIGAEHADAVVAVGVHAAALGPRGHALDLPAVVGRAHVPADRAQQLGDGLQAVGLLDAQLARAAHDRAAARHRRRERQQRQLVDQARHDLGLDLRRDELGRVHLDVRDRLAARGRAAVEEVDARAHALQHRQQARCASGCVDMPRTNRRDSASSVAATRNGAAEEMSPGTSTLPSSQALDRPHRDGARPLGDARAGGAQQALGVVARRHRLDHGGRAGDGVEAGEEDARLDLRRGDRQLVADRLQLAAAVDVQRRAAVAVAEHGAHQPQRHRHAVDRAAADRLVAVERERAALADEQARAAGASACPRCGRRSGPSGGAAGRAARSRARAGASSPRRAARRARPATRRRPAWRACRRSPRSR